MEVNHDGIFGTYNYSNDYVAKLPPEAKAYVVEIDPGIVEVGRNYNPEHPYSSPKVHTHVADARTFLRDPELRL